MNERVRAAVAAVRDPELNVLTIEELGVLREVAVDGGRVVVTVTPTYLGCPAMATIKSDIVAAATAAGGREVEVVVSYSPPWTTDWLGEAARAKLTAAGTAPPRRGPGGETPSGRGPGGETPSGRAPGGETPSRREPGEETPSRRGPTLVTLSVRCPRCGSPDTSELSRAGSTACLSLWRCAACSQPFDHLKDH